MWRLERRLELPGTADESSFFEDGCPANRLTLRPHQKAKANLSTGARGVGLSSAESRRMSASIGSLVAAVPGALADLSGPLGERPEGELPNSDLVRRIWSSVRDLRDVHGVSEEGMANVVPGSWRNRASRANEEEASGLSVMEVLPAHDGETISSHKVQHIQAGQQVNRVRFQRYVASLDQLPEVAGPSGWKDLFGGIETSLRDLAKTRQRNLSGPGAVACSRARPVDPARIIPASAFVSIGRRCQGIEEALAARCPCCEATDVNARHGRTCNRAGAHVNRHQPLVHALSRNFKRLSIRHQVDSGAPFNADRNLRMDIVIEREASETLRRHIVPSPPRT